MSKIDLAHSGAVKYHLDSRHERWLPMLKEQMPRKSSPKKLRPERQKMERSKKAGTRDRLGIYLPTT